MSIEHDLLTLNGLFANFFNSGVNVLYLISDTLHIISDACHLVIDDVRGLQTMCGYHQSFLLRQFV